MDLSVIIPVYNEEENIKILNNKLRQALENLKKRYEIIFIDDCSQDSTLEILNELKKTDNFLRIIHFNENLGQSEALNFGFKKAKGKIIISLDGDLQNDPIDIPDLLKKLNEGYDVVCGWRYNRKDSKIIKTIPSKIANRFVRKITGIKIHDISCTLRAYRANCVKDLTLFKGGHRLIPTILSKKGYKITEIKVKHNPRIYGKAKYNSPFRVFEFISGLRKVCKNS